MGSNENPTPTGPSTRPSNKEQRRYMAGQQPFSAHDSPYSITPPNYSYLARYNTPPNALSSTQGGFEEKRPYNRDPEAGRNQKRQDLTDSIMDWYSTRSGTRGVPQPGDYDERDSTDGHSVRRRNSLYSNASNDSDMTGEDEPRDRKESHNRRGSEEDIEKETLRQMDYKTRRKHIQRIRIQFNVSSTNFIRSLTAALYLSIYSLEIQIRISAKIGPCPHDLWRPFAQDRISTNGCRENPGSRSRVHLPSRNDYMFFRRTRSRLVGNPLRKMRRTTFSWCTS